jgi:sugar lactone lactonase YvrE
LGRILFLKIEMETFGLQPRMGEDKWNDQGGVWRYDGKSYTKFTTKEGLIHNGVFCTVEDQDGNLWFGTRNMGLCRYDGKVFTKFSE